MAGINKVILVGHLGKDPELRAIDNGRSVVRFTLATTETYKTKAGEKVNQTEWHNIVLWTPLAEIADKFLKKGKQIYLEGKISNRSYQDKEGNTKYITEIIGQNMTLLGKKEEGEFFETSNFQSNSAASTDDGIDDLPF
jgi:single-strand DNA-binding protein